MTRNQIKIIELAKKNEGIVTTKQAIDALADQYFCNADRHVGETLSRMVKSGILERHKRGVYRLLQVPVGRSQPVVENQTSLF